MRIVFMGTPEFAVPTLERIVADGHEVTLVITQPDKPVGRKQTLTPPPVKVCAAAHGIPVFQPSSMKTADSLEVLEAQAPDLVVVVAFGQILPKTVLDTPRHGCINVHASLLPRYRGAAPIQWAVINGEPEVGVTTMQMDVGLDTGDMLLRCSRPLPNDMTAGELHDLLAQDGASLLSDTIKALENGSLRPEKQPEESNYASMLHKGLSPLDFSKSAKALHDQVRGMNPWPSANCRLHGKTLKVHRSQVGEVTEQAAGTVCSLEPFAVACGDGRTLCLLDVQYEGKQRMKAADFLRGHAVSVGERLE